MHVGAYPCRNARQLLPRANHGARPMLARRCRLLADLARRCTVVHCGQTGPPGGGAMSVRCRLIVQALIATDGARSALRDVGQWDWGSALRDVGQWDWGSALRDVGQWGYQSGCARRGTQFDRARHACWCITTGSWRANFNTEQCSFIHSWGGDAGCERGA